MISDNAIPHCGLELGCCSRQIPYDLLSHDKMVHDEGYQQGRKDAIDEYRQMLFDSLFEDGLWRCVTENDIDTIAEQLKDKVNG